MSHRRVWPLCIVPLVRGSQALTSAQQERHARRWMAAFGEIAPLLGALAHTELTYAFCARENQLYVEFSLEPNRQLQLQFERKPATAYTLMAAEVRQARQALHVAQAALDAEIEFLRAGAFPEPPTSHRRALHGILHAFQGQQLQMDLDGALAHLSVAQLPPVALDTLPDTLRIRGQVLKAARHQIRLGGVQRLSHGAMRPLRKTAQVKLSQTDDAPRFSLLAHAAMLTDTAIDLEVVELVSPLSRRHAGYRVMRILNADILSATVQEWLGVLQPYSYDDSPMP
ncbi:hypothetical protein [Viridibacterium curvum]|uniref:Uncharacterized protein n=1 Tax=Viridibacterium curvum TaxID=1101404 RepID=A0ABP9R7E1_9RHOO